MKNKTKSILENIGMVIFGLAIGSLAMIIILLSINFLLEVPRQLNEIIELLRVK